MNCIVCLCVCVFILFVVFIMVILYVDLNKCILCKIGCKLWIVFGVSDFLGVLCKVFSVLENNRLLFFLWFNEKYMLFWFWIDVNSVFLSFCNLNVLFRLNWVSVVLVFNCLLC